MRSVAVFSRCWDDLRRHSKNGEVHIPPTRRLLKDLSKDMGDIKLETGIAACEAIFVLQLGGLSEGSDGQM